MNEDKDIAIIERPKDEIVMNPGNLSTDNTNHQVLQIRERGNEQIELQDAGTVKRVVLNKTDFKKMAEAKQASDEAGADAKLNRSEMGRREKIMTKCCLSVCCCCFPKLNKALVNEGNRAILFRYGRISKSGVSGAGRYTLYKNVDEIRIVNIQDSHMKFTIPEMFTIEQITLTLNCILSYQIVSPVKAILNVVDWESSIRLMAASIIRDKVGTHTLADILQNRESYQESILKELVEMSIMWGVRILRVELKDFNVIRNVLMTAETQKPAVQPKAPVTKQPTTTQITVTVNTNT